MVKISTQKSHPKVVFCLCNFFRGSKMKAVIAYAHKLLRIIYKILVTHQEYDKEKVLGLRQQF